MPGMLVGQGFFRCVGRERVRFRYPLGNFTGSRRSEVPNDEEGLRRTPAQIRQSGSLASQEYADWREV